jgi:hypothetical protein
MSKVEVGDGTPLFDGTRRDMDDTLTPTWITHLRKFMQDNDIQVKEDTPNIRRRRRHDSFLITVTTALPLTPRQRLYFQQCRNYLQVTLVSEIATGDGKYLLPGIAKGRRDPTRRRYIRYPHQPRPSKRAWATWRRILRRIATGDRLKTPLGEWTDEDTDWEWFYAPNATVYTERTGHHGTDTTANDGDDKVDETSSAPEATPSIALRPLSSAPRS